MRQSTLLSEEKRPADIASSPTPCAPGLPAGAPSRVDRVGPQTIWPSVGRAGSSSGTLVRQ